MRKKPTTLISRWNLPWLRYCVMLLEKCIMGYYSIVVWVTYHTLPSLYVCVWLVDTLNSTAPIGSLTICVWSPADICEQWEKNLSVCSADVSGAGTRDEPLKNIAKRTVCIFSVSSQSRCPFSASLQAFCLTVRAYLNTQKYGLFCSLDCTQVNQRSWETTADVFGKFLFRSFRIARDRKRKMIQPKTLDLQSQSKLLGHFIFLTSQC